MLAKRISAKNSADFIKRLGEMLEKGFTIGDAVDFLMLNVTGVSKKKSAPHKNKLKKGTPFK